MVRYFVALAAIFAIDLVAHHDPITDFPWHNFLGQGYYATSAGEEGTYVSYAKIYGNEWHLNIAKDGHLFSYGLLFEFADDGFFSVRGVETVDGQETTYDGQGYCTSSQCHYSFELEDRLIEETITFTSGTGSILKIGSMRYQDENDETQSFVWEETLYQLPESDDGSADE